MRAILRRIKEIPRNIKFFLINIWWARKALWHGRSWDCSYLYYHMVAALEQMEYTHTHHGHLVNNEKYAREMRVAIHILNRLIEDNYDTRYLKLVDIKPEEAKDSLERTLLFRLEPISDLVPSGRGGMKITTSVKKNDLALLAHLLAKHSPAWWD